MEAHVIFWNGFIGIVSTAIILYLGDLIIRYRQRCKELREELAAVTEAARQK